MNRTWYRTIVGAILIWSVPPVEAQESPRRESLGPLVRFDPNAKPLGNLVKIYGDPSLGLTSCSTGISKRLGESDQWIVGLGDSIGHPAGVALMELDRKAGRLRMRELMELSQFADVSSAAGLIFACRKDHRDADTWECFSMSENRPLWSVGNDVYVMDAVFSSNGTQLIVLLGVGEMNLTMSCEVRWYDARSGRVIRGVSLPGKGSPGLSSANRSQLAVSAGDVFVAVTDGESGGFYRISAKSEDVVALDPGDMRWGDAPKIEVGGVNQEYLVFHDDDRVRIARSEQGRLKVLGEGSINSPDDGSSYRPNVHFSPDGRWLVIARFGSTTVMPIDGKGVGKPVKVLKEGGSSGDFTSDGKYYVCIDDGGGRAWNTESWTPDNSLEIREHPVHCCPITEAGISISGNYIISSDSDRLLLWSKKGEILAQLISDRAEDGVVLQMQSAVILENQRKIYAADGWHFLEWDMEEIDRRLARKPMNVPRIMGQVVFDDRKSTSREPELMNLSLDGSGRYLITATRSEVRFRSTESVAESKVLPVPEREIFMKPRSFRIAEDPPRVLLLSGKNLFELDPGGAKDAALKRRSVGAIDLVGERAFVFGVANAKRFELRSVPLYGSPPDDRDSGNEWTVPLDPKLVNPYSGLLAAAKSGLLIGTSENADKGGYTLSAFDSKSGKTLWSEEIRWEPKSISLSEDGSKLLVGSRNKAVYVFGLEAVSKGR